MSKSVLLIDTPEAYCSISDNDKDASLMKKIDCEYGYCQGKPDWCPLKPLPDKMKLTGVYGREYFQSNGKMPSYKIGWNDCLDAIKGEK